MSNDEEAMRLSPGSVVRGERERERRDLSEREIVCVSERER